MLTVILFQARSRFEAATNDWEKINGRDTDSISNISQSRNIGLQNLTSKIKKTFKVSIVISLMNHSLV